MAAWDSEILHTGLMGFFLNPDKSENEPTNFAIVLGPSETADGIPLGSGALAWNSNNHSRIIKKLQSKLKALEQ